MHEGNVVHVDDRAVNLFDRQIIDFFECDRAGIQRDVPVKLTQLLVAGRQDKVLH